MEEDTGRVGHDCIALIRISRWHNPCSLAVYPVTEPIRRLVLEHTHGSLAGLFQITGLFTGDLATLPTNSDGCDLITVKDRYIHYRQLGEGMKTMYPVKS